MYEVQYLDEDKDSISFGKWFSIPLEMCRPSRHCGCYDKGEMDNCDFAFDDTECLQVAKDKKEMLEEDGLKVRIKNSKKEHP